eukprot:Skav233296  [mRNA]  locus=scaffold1501:73449:83388:+ [translate_table: standard]
MDMPTDEIFSIRWQTFSESTTLSPGEVVPWVDRDDPINGSTMEIFVDPAVALKKLRRAAGRGSKVFCIEAAVAARKEREDENLTQADGPGKDWKKQNQFVTAILTMQTFAVAKVVKADTPERLVWFLIGLAFVLSAGGAYRIFQVVSKVLQTTTQTEMDSEQLKMKPERLAELRKGSASASIQVEGWTFVDWKDLVKAGREGEESALSSSFSSDSELPSKSEDGELGVSDMLWQRRTVKRMTGSYAGFLVLPCLAFTLLVAVSAAATHVFIYSCSSGELEALYMAGVKDAMTFNASQDRYVVMLDSSFQQVVLEAVGTEYLAREISFRPGQKASSSTQSPNSANALIELHSMKIPRVVDVAVSGLRPSLNSTNYTIRFAPKQLLPQKLLITSEDDTFQRCIPFSTLPGSRLSIPSNVSKVKVSVFFADYVVGVPLEHGRAVSAVESTWTAFAPRGKSCTELCHGSPHCLHAYEGALWGFGDLGSGIHCILDGHAGCFFAHHNYDVQAERCDHISEVNISSGTFKADLQGCLVSSNSSTCGSAAVEQHVADFGLVEPSWRGEAVADLDFSLVMNASWQDLPVLSQAVALRRGRPQVADVLVNITGRTEQNDTIDIPTRGKVLENGDIVLTVSKYDMTEMTSLEMVIAPILADETFQVRWLEQTLTGRLEEGTGFDIPDEDLPIFSRCLESEILFRRYRACQKAGGTGDWNASVLRRTVIPDFQGVEIRFVIEPQSASSDSGLEWGNLRSHSITPEFVGVDAPLAWAAQQHGCHLLENKAELLRSSLRTDPAHSADAMCEFLSCNQTGNSAWQHNPGCDVPNSRLNDAFQATSNVVKLMACFDKFCSTRLETSRVEFQNGAVGTPWAFGSLRSGST